MALSKKSRNVTTSVTFMNAQAADGSGSSMHVGPYRNIIIAISTSGSANLTVKVEGTVESSEPDWASAASPSNIYANVGLFPYDSNTYIAGATGVVFAGADRTELYEVNTNGLAWVNFRVSGYSAGAVTIKAMLTDNK